MSGMAQWGSKGEMAFAIALLATGLVSLGAGTGREKGVIDPSVASRVAALEARVAAEPTAPEGVVDLAEAYIDARTPGLALGLVESSSRELRSRPSVAHVYARALLDTGHATLALEAEDDALVGFTREPCETVLRAAIVRRRALLVALVERGVEDAPAHPEAAAIAYRTVTLGATVALR